MFYSAVRTVSLNKAVCANIASSSSHLYSFNFFLLSSSFPWIMCPLLLYLREWLLKLPNKSGDNNNFYVFESDESSWGNSSFAELGATGAEHLDSITIEHLLPPPGCDGFNNNLLAPELFFLILAHSVYKMWITQEPNTLELWNKLHFEEKKTESIYHV